MLESKAVQAMLKECRRGMQRDIAWAGEHRARAQRMSEMESAASSSASLHAGAEAATASAVGGGGIGGFGGALGGGGALGAYADDGFEDDGDEESGIEVGARVCIAGLLSESRAPLNGLMASVVGQHKGE